ncbi:MAG: hypothetical protein RLZZ383_2884 [Pseudomonadota bacterium]|jgi:phenylpropionate dioxygenase-like ring-hydroxylating dioxygenase large terminal subunit
MLEPRQHAVFARTDRVAAAWTWALPSAALGRRGVVQVRVLGRDLVLWRDDEGRPHAWDAHCPHMGAHLARGKVTAEGLHCFFHGWVFDETGQLARVPCADHPPRVAVTVWPVQERYGLVFVWPGPEAGAPLPEIPALAGQPVRSMLGARFEKGCHPNVVMVNAIDEQHFASVHHLPVDLHFHVTEHSAYAASWENTSLPPDSSFGRLLRRFYQGPLTYRMTYWGGTMGSVSVGPDAWHFHIVFALRLTDAGTTEGYPILLSPRVPGVAGAVWNALSLGASALVGAYFARGDTEVFQTIRWDLRTPIAADRSILRFIQHVDAQPAVTLGDWTPVAGR